MKHQIYILLLCIGSLWGCRDPFNPPEIQNFNELIVIEANVNGTTGEASVVLSISKPLDSEDATLYISGADVYLQSEAGANYYLTFQGDGKYIASNVYLDYGDEIQLYVAVGNRQYMSEYEEFIKTPEIDSVTFNADTDGVQVFVSTHDLENQTLYYKWDYFETWIFSAAFTSSFVYDTYPNGDLILSSISGRSRSQIDSMQFCFKDHASTQIILGTSENLSQDIISENELLFSSHAEGKFKYRYSVLVKQNALTKRSYDYWSLLRSNTEDLGSIFDKQPSNFDSNIRNISSPDEGVLGYFSVFSETQKRIFIDAADVPEHETSETLSDLCTAELLAYFDPIIGYSPLSAEINSRYIVTVYDSSGLVSSPICCDCRFTGYYETPDFWEE